MSRAIKVAIAIIISKIQITQSVVTFKWSSRERPVSVRKTEICDRNRMASPHALSAGALAIEVSVIDWNC